MSKKNEIEIPEGTEDEWKEIGGKIVLVEEKKSRQ